MEEDITFRASRELITPPETISGDASTEVDGGWVCWSQTLVSHLLVINSFGYLSSFALFESHWTSSLHRTHSEIAWVGSLQIFLLFFMGTVSGRIVDAGYIRSLIFAGCALQLLGTFATSVVGHYWQLILAQGVTNGLGNGVLFTPAVALVSTRFMKKRAFALSVAACGAPVGGVMFPIITRQLAPQIGYPWTIRVMGLVMLCNSALIMALAKPTIASRVRGPWVEWAAFREPVYLLFNVGIFFVLLGVYIAYFYTTTFGKDVIHIPSSRSLVNLMVLNAVGVPGRMIPALIADAWFGAFNVLVPFVFASGIMLYCWAAVSNVGGFTAFVIIYGICVNAVQTLFPSSLAGLTSDLTKMGTRVGMSFTILSFACLSGPPSAGALIGRGGGDYLYAQVFGGTTVVLGGVVLLLVWVKMRKDTL